ncbi:DNase I-like protein, partial [Lentinus brumalis]
MSQSLHIVYHNVNHSPQHTHLILEQCAAMKVDIVCLQEPWYGPIRPIPSASPAGPAERTEDNMLYGTQLHPAWHLIEARKDARVVCHVSRRLINAVISLDPTVQHRDCMLLLVRLEPDQDPVAILNVYNDGNNAAVEYLADHAHLLPAIDIAGGDYNTHSTVWDPTYPPDSMARTGEVLDLHARLGLRLLSPIGVPTHYPHRSTLRPTVIDLVWVPDDRPHELYRVHVAPHERGLSDHAVIHAHIPAGEWSYEGQPSIAPNSEAEGAFVASIRSSVRVLLPAEAALESVDDLRHAVSTLFACIEDAWSSHATPTVICDKSRLWWNRACTDARKALNTARERVEILKTTAPQLVPAARIAERRAFRHLKSTIRKRRAEHLDERIQFVATQQK